MYADCLPHILHCLVNCGRRVGTKRNIQYKLLSVLLHITISICVLVACLCQILLCLINIISLTVCFVVIRIIAYGIRKCLAKRLCIAVACYLCDDITVNCIGQCLSQVHISGRTALAAVHLQIILTGTGHLYHLNVIHALYL